MSLPALWYRGSALLYLLWPLSFLYRQIASLRKQAYLSGRKPRYKAPVPVLVVGNITAGGAGKTPLVIALVELLQQNGWHPGVVSRGYRSSHLHTPVIVNDKLTALDVGDEAKMIAQRTGSLVAVFPERRKAIEALLAVQAADIIVCDDGLQHYALERDIEIAVVDGERLHGNGMCLPAGPLREPVERLSEVDFVVYNTVAESSDTHFNENDWQYHYTSHTESLCMLSGEECRPLADFAGLAVHVVAGIANPLRFFNVLRKAGIDVQEHAFPDHHHYTADDLQFNDDLPIVMTEKDAVKCTLLGLQKTCWYTQQTVTLAAAFEEGILERVEALRPSGKLQNDVPDVSSDQL